MFTGTLLPLSIAHLQMPIQFNVQLMSWPDALRHARSVRDQVFIVEQGVPRELEWDEWDERSEHAVALDPGSNAIGTARLLPDGRIGRMAVLGHWRRKGVGAALLSALLKLACDKGMTEVTLHAQTHAAGFYRRFGFTERGKEFTEAGIPHQAMSLKLTGSPER